MSERGHDFGLKSLPVPGLFVELFPECQIVKLCSVNSAERCKGIRQRPRPDRPYLLSLPSRGRDWGGREPRKCPSTENSTRDIIPQTPMPKINTPSSASLLPRESAQTR